ncbi:MULTISPECIES: hypothetical protein [Acidianus]|uniref:Uncharacterized protein n=1 Tax=Candidatus Acidianus copahuensis TaxID=1160895 RepID=A0A031LKK4_9CREN|nr:MULTISPECIES: hypothetical protein [Acidianus]EZQ02086.1 hypothetical protein CM19_11520 [Candidatus Acidianus copahuensis]NON63287.1 hypothetical protein [Acidianus sp. RZ1]
MTISKKFIEMQDLILAKTSLEKVKLHVEERKGNTIYSWVGNEVAEFMRRYSKDKELNPCTSSLEKSLKEQDSESLMKSVNDCIKILSKKIELTYNSLMEDQK